MKDFLLEKRLSSDAVIDKLSIDKSERELSVYSKGKLLKTYSISLGKEPIGDKQFEGDNKTPEGLYFINGKNSQSSYYKNLGISYPNSEDRNEAKKLSKSAGGDIKIHGLPNKLPFLGRLHRITDWTAGCVAVTNEEMDELFNTVKMGTPIEIKP
ncbi:L,D-transpeptidase family protein [uncultured Pontibacter sp.]|uniref:L,D-transpeptidase family protein n=1 Tax=uncultured Pontibacter sp. TaxID=453356 RepID=UPI00262A0AB6|nr:L,D-transpeptidase family protein [uncultured Pontibacter sp.]